MKPNDLYTVQSKTKTESKICCKLLLDADHAVFKGHFPGQPVLPGVCMLDIIAEITGNSLNQKFRISGGPIIKFLNMIDPVKNPLIDLEIDFQNEAYSLIVTGKLFFGTLVFMKCQLALVPVK